MQGKGGRAMNKIEIPGIFRELLKINTADNNIVGVGQGHKFVRGKNTGQQALTILVKKKHQRSNLERSVLLPRILNNMQTDIIEVGDIRLQDERREFCRPAQPGMSLGHYKISAGTFGAVVKDKTSGQLLILSNNHVLANITDGNDGRSAVGDPITQPGTYDGGRAKGGTIAHLHRFVPLYREAVSPRCKIARSFQLVLNKCIHIFRPQYQVQLLRAQLSQPEEGR